MAEKIYKNIIMKKIIIYSLIILFNNNCSSQNNKKMENFNISYFESDNISLMEKTIIKNDTIEKIGFIGNGYYKITSTVNSPFVEKKYFFQNTNLESEGNFFYEVPIGHYKNYDSLGNLKSEINFDTQRKFSIDQLIDKMKLDFNTDLLKNTEEKSVSVTISSSNVLSYDIVLKNFYSSGLHRQINISAEDGKVLSDREMYYKK